MQGFNVIIVFHHEEEKILMCERKKDPYKGKSNFVGGKIEKKELGIDAAYRELEEETNIKRNDIVLYHLMDYVYHIADCYVEVYVGKLIHDVSLIEEKNRLFWSDLNHNFFDMNIYAGEGNIGHMLEQVRLFKDILFKKDKTK
jgi:8-oxo-dGTP diphosphatase